MLSETPQFHRSLHHHHRHYTIVFTTREGHVVSGCRVAISIMWLLQDCPRRAAPTYYPEFLSKTTPQQFLTPESCSILVQLSREPSCHPYLAPAIGLVPHFSELGNQVFQASLENCDLSSSEVGQPADELGQCAFTRLCEVMLFALNTNAAFIHAFAFAPRVRPKSLGKLTRLG